MGKLRNSKRRADSGGTELRIIGKVYRVQIVPEDTFHGRYGDCDTEKLVIRICDGLEPQQHADTVLHEVMHALWRAFDLPPADEERAVTNLATGICAVLSDNAEPIPKFMRKSKCRAAD